MKLSLNHSFIGAILRGGLLLALPLLAVLSANAQPASDADSKYATEMLKKDAVVSDFKLTTLDGKTLKLSKFLKGKYTLIDFWASWCGDCRADMPNLKRIRKEFVPCGLQLLGVSFDTDKQAWQNAVSKYSLDYTQVSELVKMRESAVAKAFGIQWIPSLVLVNPEGKVVLSTVLSDKMERTLTELFAPTTPVDGTKSDVSLQGSVGKLAAIVQKPALQPNEKCPMVILCHGFTGRKEGQLFDLIADSLCAHGIASLRFDFNGHGQSEGDFQNMTVVNEVEDAKKVYDYVRQLGYVSQIALVGHSQGGVVASMVAGELGSEKISAVALMAPAAVLRDDAIRGNTMGKTYNPLDPPAYVEMPGGQKLGRNYIKSAFTLPIYETATNYNGPAIIVHGTGDRVVPYTYGLRYHQLWKGSKYCELAGFDHVFSQNVYRATRLVSDYLIATLNR